MKQTIEARLNKIVFQNIETSFLIGSFSVEDELLQANITAKGNILSPQVGLTYKLTIQEEPANKYGQQFKIISYETMLPLDPNGIFKYIVRVCSFVGPSVGTAIVGAYGAETIRIMKEEPERIAAEIKGITIERALEIQQVLNENEINERQMIELETLLDVPGMRKNLPVRLIEEFGPEEAVHNLKKNPYVITDFKGIGFTLADMVAIQKINYDPEGLERKRQVALHCLREEMQKTGSTWINERVLLSEMESLVPVKSLMSGIESLMIEGQLVMITEWVENIKSNFYTFRSTYLAEITIADTIAELLNWGK